MVDAASVTTARPLDRASTRAAFALDASVATLRDAQRELAGLLKRQRLALAANDAAALADLGRREQEIATQTLALDTQRREHLAALTAALTPGRDAPLSVADVAGLVPEPLASRLRVHRAELRDLAEANQQDARAMRMASEALLRHVTGTLQTLRTAAAGGAAYGQSGRLNVPPPRLSTLNLSA